MSDCGAAIRARALTSTPSPARVASTSMSSAACPGDGWAMTASATTTGKMLHDLTLLNYHSTFAEHPDRVLVGPGETSFGRRTPRQPLVSDVLVARQRHLGALGQGQTEDLLAVVERSRRKAVAPLGVDLETVDHAPPREPARGGLDARFFHDFPGGRRFE